MSMPRGEAGQACVEGCRRIDGFAPDECLVSPVAEGGWLGEAVSVPPPLRFRRGAFFIARGLFPDTRSSPGR